MAQLLVVEDDAAIAATLRDALHDAGHSVRLAGTGAAALDELHQELPDLILLDLMLPDMDGWTFLRRRERELARVPVLVVSAAGPGGAAAAHELGAPIFLAKPFDLDVLLGQIDRLCSGNVRQCAWCGRVMNDDGSFQTRSSHKLRWATHGICPECKERERREFLN